MQKYDPHATFCCKNCFYLATESLNSAACPECGGGFIPVPFLCGRIKAGLVFCGLSLLFAHLFAFLYIIVFLGSSASPPSMYVIFVFFLVSFKLVDIRLFKDFAVKENTHLRFVAILAGLGALAVSSVAVIMDAHGVWAREPHLLMMLAFGSGCVGSNLYYCEAVAFPRWRTLREQLGWFPLIITSVILALAGFNLAFGMIFLHFYDWRYHDLQLLNSLRDLNVVHRLTNLGTLMLLLSGIGIGAWYFHAVRFFSRPPTRQQDGDVQLRHIRRREDMLNRVESIDE